jgi:hypothetical protein
VGERDCDGLPEKEDDTVMLRDIVRVTVADDDKVTVVEKPLRVLEPL